MIPAMVLSLAVIQGSAAVIEGLKQIEHRLATVWQEGDCAAWGGMLAPDWSVIHVTGSIMTRAQALDHCRAPRTGPVTAAIDDLSVRVFGDAAVVTGRTRYSVGGAEPSALTFRFTDVFVRRADRWQVVASQATQVLSPNGR